MKVDFNEIRTRRGIYLLPNLLTTCCLFGGFYAVVAAIDGNFGRAATAIFVAMVFDGLDGRVARLMGTETAFGKEFDSLADMVAFGIAPAIVCYQWGVARIAEYGAAWGRFGWIAAFFFAATAAMRLARFNVQSTMAVATDKRYFVGMPSPAAAGVIAATVYLFPYGPQDQQMALAALVMVVVPALLMVSTIRFRSFKTIDLQTRRPYTVLLLIAVAIMLIATHAQAVLVAMAYTYLASAFIGMAVNRLRRREGKPADEEVRKEIRDGTG